MLERAGILEKIVAMLLFIYSPKKSVAGRQNKSVDRKGSRKVFELDKVVQGTVVPDHLVDCPDSKQGPPIVLLLIICPPVGCAVVRYSVYQ